MSSDRPGNAAIAAFSSVLGVAVAERTADGTLRAVEPVPAWARPLLAPLGAGPPDQDTFLGNFLVDAEEFWSSGEPGRLSSGLWEETVDDGRAMYLEAQAVTTAAGKLLLLRDAGELHDVQHSALQAAREARLAQERLVREMQARDVLLQCIVHDLAGPLTGVFGAFRLLQSQDLDEGARELVDIGMSGAKRQKHLIRNVLESFRAELRSLEPLSPSPQPPPVVVDAVRGVVSELGPAFGEKGVQLRTVGGDDLEGVRSVGDRSRLERVVTNLVENALRHSPEGTTCTVRLEAEPRAVTVSVEDQGPGVDPAVAASVFLRGARTESTGGSAGLGLYFCRLTVERWGGDIGHEPGPGGGSRFWIRLPRRDPEPS